MRGRSRGNPLQGRCSARARGGRRRCCRRRWVSGSRGPWPGCSMTWSSSIWTAGWCVALTKLNEFSPYDPLMMLEVLLSGYVSGSLRFRICDLSNHVATVKLELRNRTAYSCPPTSLASPRALSWLDATGLLQAPKPTIGLSERWLREAEVHLLGAQSSGS